MTKQSGPTPAAVSLWLKQLSREELHGNGWIAANKRFHSITRAVRPFLREQFPDPKEQEAAYDGLTLALLTLAHFEDIERLSELFREHTPESSPTKLP